MVAKAKSKKSEIKGHLFGIKLVEKFIEFLRSLFSEKILAFMLKWAMVVGHFALIAAAVIGLLFAIIYAIRVNDFYAFLVGIAWFLLVFVVQYIAHRFSDAGENLIKNNPTRLASKAFLDCVAFLFVIAGLVVIIIHLIGLIRTGDFNTFLMGLGIFLFFEFIAMVSFNFKTVTIEIVKDTSAGQEAIGIVTFFIKGLMKLVPLFFGVGVAIGTIMLFVDSFGLFSDARISSAWISGNANGMSILTAGLLPFIAYIVFVLYYLVVDIVRAILSLPGKIDGISKK
jgi:hypothetical protein